MRALPRTASQFCEVILKLSMVVYREDGAGVEVVLDDGLARGERHLPRAALVHLACPPLCLRRKDLLGPVASIKKNKTPAPLRTGPPRLPTEPTTTAHSNVLWYRGGLVFEAHGLLYPSA